MPPCPTDRPRPDPAPPRVDGRRLAIALSLCGLLAQAAAAVPADHLPEGPAATATSAAATDAAAGTAAIPPNTAPRRVPTPVFHGPTSFYGATLKGRPTASGEPYSPQALTMAHRALPFGSWVRVTNLQNQRSVVVRVNDRGPFAGRRVADLSKAAAHRLNMLQAGVVMARFEVLTGPPGDALDGTLETEADPGRPSGG
jgi:rare lipoprotein A